jgi:hypothetical protein
MALTLFPHFPQPVTVDQGLDDKHDLLFLEPDKAIEALDPSQRDAVNAWLANSSDRESDVKRMAMRGFLADVYGEPDPTPERFDFLKHEYAAQALPVPAGAQVDDDLFFDLVKDHRQKNRDRKNLFTGIAEAATDAAISISPDRVKERRGIVFDKPDGLPGYQADDLPALMGIWQGTTAKMRARVESLMPVVNFIEGHLRAEDDATLLEFITPAAERLKSVSAENIEGLSISPRDIVLELVRQKLVSGGTGRGGRGIAGFKPDEPDFLEGILKGAERGAENFTYDLIDRAERVIEAVPGTEDQSEYRQIEGQLRALQQGKLSPLASKNYVKRGFFGAAESAAFSAAVASGSAGLVLTGLAFEQQTYERFKAEGMTETQANVMAPIAGAGMAAVEKLKLAMWMKIPGMTKATGALARVVNPGNYIAREAMKGSGIVLGETVAEGVQGHAIKELTQQVGAWISKDIKAPDWMDAWNRAVEESPDVMLSMIPLVGLGHVMGGARDIRAANALARHGTLLRAAGFSPDQAQSIVTAERPVAELRKLWGDRRPMDGAPAGATPGDVASAAVEAVRAERSAIADDLAATPGVSAVRRNAAGWEVERNDGTVMKVDSADAVAPLLVEMARATNEEGARAYLDLIEHFTQQDVAEGVGSVTGVNKETKTARRDEAGNVSVQDSAGLNIPFSEETTKNLQAEMQAVGLDKAVIRGTNYALADDVGRLVRHYETNAGGDITTILHERFERLYNEGRVTQLDVFKAANVLTQLPEFRPDKIRDPGQRKIAEKLRRIAEDDPGMSEADKRETIMELAVADVIGQFRDGTRLPAGAIEAGLRDAALVGATPDQRAAAGTLRGLLRLVRKYLEAMFGLASRIARARRKGKLKPGDDWSSVIDKLLGLDGQKKHEAAVMKETSGVGNRAEGEPSTGIAGGLHGTPDAGITETAGTFSLGSVNTLEHVAARFEERLAAGGPAVKLEAYADTARTLAGMARAARGNEETENILRAGEIETKRREMQRKLEDDYILDVYRGPVGGILSDEESAELKSNPLIQKIIRPTEKKEKGIAGRFMSPVKARKAGKQLAGEYEDALNRGLPGWLFKGEMQPDLMADELGMTVPEMWEAIESALDSVAKRRRDLENAKQQIAEAKARARNEARAWASAERVKLATSDKRDAQRALVTLDAMMMHLPAEVRAKVGGFTRVGELKTNEARRRHFLNMVDRIDVAMEDFLRKQYVAGIREVIEKGKAKAIPGQKDRGKLGVNAHTWLETADAVMKMSETALTDRMAGIAARLSGTEEMTPEEISDLNRTWDFGTGEDAARIALEVEEGILDLFGGATHREEGRYVRTSTELEAAWNAARETTTTGRQQWQAQLIHRRERRAGRRAGLKVESGVDASNVLAAIGERKAAMQGMGGAATRYFRKGFDFQSFVGDIFGREGDTHLWAEGIALEATLTESALWQQAQHDLTGFLATLWPRTGTLGRLRHLENLSTPRDVPGAPDVGKLSEMQAVHFSMLWADNDSRVWLRQHGLGEDAQGAFEAWLSPQAKAIRGWLQDRYDAQYDILNEVYRRIHGVNMPRVLMYTPRMVLHGKDAIVIDPLGSGGLSARGVFAGFTKRRRPQISAAPVAADALQAFTQNQRVVTHFVAWAEASAELRGVFSTSDTAPFIQAAAGAEGAADLNQWLSDMETAGVREAQASAYMKQFMRANVDNALVGKLGVLAKQLPAMYGAAVEIGWSDYLRSLGRVLRGTAARPVSEVMESRIMRSRQFNRPPEISQAASGTGASPMTARLRRLGVDLNAIDVSMVWLRNRIGAVDAWFTARGAAIAYDAHFRDGQVQYPGDDAAAHAYAERETERTISRTAQPDSLASKSLFENHAGTWGRLFFQFQSANRQALFMTVAAFRDGGVKSGDAWRKAVTHWALTGLVVQTMGTVVRDMISDDDEDETWQIGDFVRAMAFGPLTGALHFGPMIDAAASLVGGFERRQAAGPAGAVAAIGKEVLELFKEGDEFDLKDNEKLVRGLGLFLGGRWSALNVGANLGKQVVGIGDNLVTTDTEAVERKAGLRRKQEKEQREAREAKLTPDEREALRAMRKRRKELKLHGDALEWDALNQ